MGSRTPGRYEALQPLGGGPYGTVSLARDVFSGTRLVAVKVLDQKALPSRAFTRLQREFMLRRALRHPGCAAFLDLDFDDDGNCRLVSEYVGGPDFVSAAAGLTDTGLCDLAVELLQALGHLHDCGLVHGAIKPTNVRLTNDPASPSLKLIDFDVRPDHEISPAAAAATLRHAAPEVLRGQAADLRADLYGVGMLLYEAIAGKLPFEDPRHGPGIVAWHLSRGVSRRPGSHLLADVVERLLDPDPDSRYPSTHEAIRAISVACGRRFRPRTPAGGEQVLITGRFIGREREVARLEGACRRLLNGGGAQMFLLAGVAGMGKTRTLDEGRVIAQMSGIRVVQAVCRRERSAPLGVLRDLLHQLLVLVGRDHQVVHAHASVIREIVAETAGDPPARPSLPAGHDWTRIKNGVAEFLADAAQLRPLVLVVDDMHCIDEASLGVLRWVLQHFSACPVMVLGALEETDKPDPAGCASRLIESEAHEVLRLNPLGVAEVERILAGVLALPGNVRELTGLVMRLTNGIPLYVEECLRSLLEGQMLDVLADGGIAVAEESAEQARERAIGLLTQRLDRLPEPAQRVLEALVLFDGAARSEDLGLAADLRSWELEGAIRRLESADFVRVEVTLAGPTVGLRGVLFREAVGRRISAERLATLHDAVVDRLSVVSPRTPDRTAELAFHAIRGTRPSAALPLCLGAAREAMALHAHDRARDLLAHARRFASATGDVPASLAILDLLADCHERLGESDAALRVLADIASSATASREMVITARLRTAGIQLEHGRTSAAERTLDAASIEAAELGDALVSSRADRLRARLLIQRGNPAKALAMLERARSLLLPRGQSEDLAHVTACMGEAHALLDEHELARARHRESLERFLLLRDKAGVALAHENLGLVACREGRHGEAVARLKRCERIARRLGHYSLLASALRHRGMIEAGAGRLSDAVRTLTSSVQLSRRLDDEPGICESLSHLSRAHHLAGRHEMARMLIEEVVTRRGRLNDLSGVASARILLGRLLSVVGALDDAETLLRTAADAAEQLGLEHISALAVQGLAEVAVRRDHAEDASALLERLRRPDCRLDRFTATSCDLLRVELMLREGRGAPARSALARALRAARASRIAEMLCEGRRLAGLLRIGTGAVASLEAACRIADRAGMRELAWRVRADLGRVLLGEDRGDEALESMREAMTLLRRLHDELPARRRDSYLSDPRKQDLRAAFSEAIDRTGAPVA